MRLADYLRDSGKSIADAAREMDEHHETVRRWVHLQVQPRRAALAKIALFSGGSVTANDFQPEPLAGDVPLAAEGVA